MNITPELVGQCVADYGDGKCCSSRASVRGFLTASLAVRDCDVTVQGGVPAP